MSQLAITLYKVHCFVHSLKSQSTIKQININGDIYKLTQTKAAENRAIEMLTMQNGIRCDVLHFVLISVRSKIFTYFKKRRQENNASVYYNSDDLLLLCQHWWIWGRGAGSFFFNFHAVFGKNWPNYRLASAPSPTFGVLPLWEILNPPPLNPPPPPPPDGHCSGRYASYWNAFLFFYGYRRLLKSVRNTSHTCHQGLIVWSWI